ncbi:MAG: BlaI/MecI/CopY family transcriptional regulator [Flavobacteriales bacterium]|jgi:predicted transcriptional regulator|nr:BlaI/MecI/CopY family transcriptional regulator [Flavobacteriales bacterium]
MKRKKELTKAEEQIMHAIWKVERGFAKDILEQLNDPKPAYNTVLTVIRVLVQKGFVKFDTFGKSNQYYPTISKEDYSAQQLKTLKQNYFNDSNAQLLSFFVKENGIDINELDDIIQLIKKEEENE